jgi:hypothetical protein
MTGLNKRITRSVIAVSIILFALVLLYLIFFYTPISLVVKESNLYSNNWSGYAVASSSTTTFNSISASWTVPDVASEPAPGYSSIWIGIGEFLEESNRLIQAGTEQDVASNGVKNYYAWFEALPKPTVNVGIFLYRKQRAAYVIIGILVIALTAAAAVAFPVFAALILITLAAVALLFSGISNVLAGLGNRKDSSWARAVNIGVGALAVVVSSIALISPFLWPDDGNSTFSV